MLVWIVLVIGSVIYVVWMAAAKHDPSSKWRYPPSPKGIPIVGHPFHLLGINHASSTRLSKQLGGSYMLTLFNLRFLFLSTWSDMKEAIINQADVFSGKQATDDESLIIIARKTFLFTDGPTWREKRRFTLHHLRNFGFGKRLMEDTIMEELNRECAALDDRPTMSVNNFFFCPFLNVLWGILAGTTYEFGDEELLRIGKAIKDTFETGSRGIIVGMIPLLKYVPGDLFRHEECQRNVRILTDFIRKQIDEHEINLFDDGEPRDYIDAYLREIKNREGTKLTEETACYHKSHLVGAIYDILHAGVETTATTLEWSLLYMATWPEIQKKVQDELDTVIGRHRQTSYSDNTMLPYIKATLMEVQRYCTVVPICSPRIAKRTTKINDFIVPEGTIVFQNLYAIHREKQVWSDPDVFRPERFLMADGKTEKYDSWIPFSLGPRICLGESLARMELFLYFTNLMHRYTFRHLTGHALPSLDPVSALTLHAQPFQLQIHKRQ